MKIAYQGIEGSYSESCAKEVYPGCETISCKTFDDVFATANENEEVKAIVPEMNRISGNIGIEPLIFKYRLNIIAEHFYFIEHNLLGLTGAKIKDIKDVYSHTQGLSQCSDFIKKNNLIEQVRADTAGSAKYVSENKDKSKAAIASKESSKIYNLEIIEKLIANEKNNITRFLLMQKSVIQPDYAKGEYITSLLFKLKSKPSALYQALGGFTINGINLTKLQSYPEKNSFSSYFFLLDLEGHLDNPKVKNSLEELGLHTSDMQILGVYSRDEFRDK